MTRTVWTVAISLAFGAAGMFLASNFRLRVEPVGGPPEPVPVAVAHAAQPAEPAKLPAAVLAPSARPVADPHVTPAAAVGPTADPPPAPVSVTLDRITDTTLVVRWKVTGAGGPYRLAGNVFDIELKGVVPADRLNDIKLNGKDKTAGDFSASNPGGGKTVIRVNTPSKLQPAGAEGANTLRFELKVGDQVIGQAEVALPGPPEAVLRAKDYTGSPHLDPYTLPTNPLPKTYIQNDTRAYIRLAGTAPVGATVQLVAQADDGDAYEVTGTPRAAGVGAWDLEFHATGVQIGNQKLKVFPRAFHGLKGTHTYGPAVVFNADAPPPAPAAPKLADPEPLDNKFKVNPDPAAPAANGPTFRANTRQLKPLKVTAQGEAEAVVLYLGTRRVGQRFPDANGEVTFDKVELKEGVEFGLRAFAVTGPFKSQEDVAAVYVRETGPRVDGVFAPGFGTNGGTERVVVKFSARSQLNPADANNKAKYFFVHNEAAGATAAQIGDALYDPIADTTTLTITGVVPGSYSVGVGTQPDNKGDISKQPPAFADVYGNKLEFSAERTGYGYSLHRLFTQAIEQVQPSATGLPLQNGPYVTFPESVPFRKVPDGFNPSDRVETRVVRLYYYRDAARVAMIVNRSVKAYAAADVDVRRRAAARARDDANKATDDRKGLEARAVKAAQDARGAEAELNDLLQQQATAKAQAGAARVAVAQRDRELLQTGRDLGRATDPTLGRVENDEAVRAQQRRVNELEEAKRALDDRLALTPEPSPTNKATAAAEVTRLQAKQRADAGDVIQMQDAQAKTQKKLDDKNREIAGLVGVPARAADLAKAQDEKVVIEAQKRRDDFNVTDKQIILSQTERDLRAAQAQFDGLTPSGRSDLKRQVDGVDLLLAAEKDQLARVRADARLRADVAADPARLLQERTTDEATRLRDGIAKADARVADLDGQITLARGKVGRLRQDEADRMTAWQSQELIELRARENEFRRDVAAATADPAIYAPGVVTSDDPVEQTSVSVIGEGLIQLRGPVKGLNTIRIMINQIDAPVGQVRLAMHTVQVNGERGDRMEKVVANIQRYIDHSRFLTVQSANLLRRAVTVVAARKAEEALATLAPGCTQADRDVRYLYAFFGKELTDELAVLDSEFLRTGNKLLSLHSMDTTSLAGALFVVSLARNDVRAEILQEFQRSLQADLPQAELEFYQAGLVGGKCCDACKDRAHYMLAQNAKFASFAGFFNTQIAGPDTLTPPQREFIRLAQIFKARLVTELQLKQRVTERAMVEERFATSYKAKLEEATRLEEDARKKLGMFQDGLQDAISRTTPVLGEILAEIDRIETEIANLVVHVEGIWAPGAAGRPHARYKLQYPAVEGAPLEISEAVNPGVRADLQDLRAKVLWFWYDPTTYADHVRPLKHRLDDVLARKTLTRDDVTEIGRLTRAIHQEIRAEAGAARQQVRGIFAHLEGREPEPSKAAAAFEAFRLRIQKRLVAGNPIYDRAQELFAAGRVQFNQLLTSGAQYEGALRKAQFARRPLDEKKLLDMLVDDIEDKFIEQLEGTRAHTANIDNHIKAVATALDDDFQTQFYNPAFRKVREAAAKYWDVTMAQIETTTVLATNRGFAKVSPAASFEFDLPKRNLAITEGFRSAKALMDEYGGLMTDPHFIALAKLYSGNPVSGAVNTGGALSPVRGVLPGLPTSADELVMAQAGPGRREGGSALEALIPDPAIYKFETGTGYEVRPTLSPDGQAVVFKLDYMYTTDVREPVRADEKHLGRVKRHFVSTDVQLGNYELREVSKYVVGLRASRTAKGVPLLQDIPGVGVLFRPLPSTESALQQNLIYSQATIFPTLFDLMGLRIAPAIADLDPLAERLSDFAARNRQLDIFQRVTDLSAARVDDALRTPLWERRMDLYRDQRSLPYQHPNGYVGPGGRLRDSVLMEGSTAPPGYDARYAYPPTPYAPSTTPEGAPRPLQVRPVGPVGPVGPPAMYGPSGPTYGGPGVPPPGVGFPPPGTGFPPQPSPTMPVPLHSPQIDPPPMPARPGVPTIPQPGMMPPGTVRIGQPTGGFPVGSR